MSYDGLKSLEQWLASKSKTAKPRANNSTLAAPTKPIPKVGPRAKRQAPAKAKARAEVFDRDPACVACDMFGKPERDFGEPDQWAHVHGRNTDKGAAKVSHPAYSLRLCAEHHRWHHGQGNHTLGILVTPRGKGFKQTLTIDGVLSDSRIVKAIKED